MRSLREQKKMQQGELADAMGYDRSVLSRVESSEKEPTADFVVAFAVAMDLPVDQVLLEAGLIPESLYAMGREYKAVIHDPEQAYTIVRLIAEIEDEREQEDAISDISAMLKARKERLRARAAAASGNKRPVNRSKDKRVGPGG